MTVYVALLRAVNVGGRKVAMADLRATVEGLGFEGVRTYVQSGNVVFGGTVTGGSAGEQPAAVADALRGAIAAAFGLDVPVVVRTRAELDAVVAGSPYVAEGLDPEATPTLFHVGFLAEEPSEEQVAVLAAAAERYRPDTCRVVGREVYLHLPGGYGDTKLHNAFVESKLRVTCTTRNWRSVLALAGLAAQTG